jgi:hypothetical protein
MTMPIDRRTLLLGLAGGLAVPSAVFAEVPVGSSRVIVEMLAFRQNGAAPKAVPVAPLPNVQTIPGRVEPLGADVLQLGSARDALAHRGSLHVLSHAAWAATVPPNGRTTALMEDVLPEGAPLAGGVAVQRSQYLFLFVNLDYAVGGHVYGMREKRRIKFGERHYFDHPAFGLIVQVRPSKDTPAAD